MTARTGIKICGLCRAEDVRRAVALGADYLGFVFATASPRCLEIAAAEVLLEEVDTGAARRVGVFQDQPARIVNDLVRRLRLDLVQLHGHEPRDFAGALDAPVLRAVHVGGEPAVRLHSEPTPLAPNVVGVLLDTRGADGRSGGTGTAASDAALESARAALPAGARVFLAGGLRAETVAARIARHRPFAVDVSSGVESAPRIKDAGRLAAFVAAVRGAS